MNLLSIQIRPKQIELTAFIVALIAANCMLLLGRVCDPLIFFPAQVSAGEWWRALTFPFVHVSGYHLLLDAGAFLFLYHGLQETSTRRRLLYVAACAAGSLGLSLCTSQLTGGLCGLSGIAHGLMAISALEITKSPDRTLRTAGIICFLVVALKSMYEGFTGQIAFNFLHFGEVGDAVAICHAGGVLGGLIIHIALNSLKR
jgi:rhomboid family GlyGly-CTERM serine protease